MSKPDLASKLRHMKIQITPGANEVLMNSNVPQAMLVKEIKKRWKIDPSALTVKDAIDLMLSSDKYVQVSQKLHKELKEKVEETSAVPRLLRKTYFTLKQLNIPASAGQVSRITRRKTNTERVYLNKLTKVGLVKKFSTKNNKIHYSIIKLKK
ncbi:MAG: hypothetical protein ACW98F_02845 [Candidatus Hodarchaeales archaeon]|jgi:hypothetical protein